MITTRRLRAIFLVFFCFTSFGFERNFFDNRWKGVSKQTPVVYLKANDDFLENLIISYFDLPIDDPIYDGYGNYLNRALLKRATDEYNNVTTSYFRLGIYGETLEGSGEEFSEESAKDKTIDIKLEKFANPLIGGQAQTRFSGKYVTGCQVAIDRTRNYSAAELLHLLVHEIGHCAGLGHTHGDKLSILAYDAPFDNFRLGDDDKAGLTALYPARADMAEQKQTFGLSSCAKP